MNAKRIWRLYSEEGLSIRPRTPRRRRAWRYRIGRKMTTAAANDVWAMDFLSDALFDGRPFRLLGVIDCHTREALAIAPRASFRAFQVAITRSRVSSRSLIWIIPAIARHLEHSDDSVPQRHFYRGRV